MKKVIRKNENFELIEEYTITQNAKKRRRTYRLQKLGYCSIDDRKRINAIINPRNNDGKGSTKRFRNRIRAEQAFILLTLAW